MTERLTDSELEEMRERCAEADMRSVTITDPRTVLALVREVRRLRREMNRLRAGIQGAKDLLDEMGAEYDLGRQRGEMYEAIFDALGEADE